MADPFELVFGVRGDSLGVEHVRAFLTTAGDEPLTWEAKGDKKSGQWVRPAQVTRAVCGFANSESGGVLIIGAHQEGGQWLVPGLVPPAGEPQLWLTNVVRTGFVRPPRCTPLSWQLDDGRVVAVLGVEPTPEPPCITRDGQVFQRVAGATPPVSDPLALARLTDQGRAARGRADDASHQLGVDLLRHSAMTRSKAYGARDDLVPILALSLATTGLPQDMERRPFYPATEDLLRRSHSSLAWAGDPFSPAEWAHIDQERHVYSWDGHHVGYSLGVSRAGAVGIAYRSEFTDDALATLATDNGPLTRAWHLLAELARQLGFYGAGHLEVLANGSLARFGAHGPDIAVRRQVAIEAPAAAAVDDIVRELARAAGQYALEPPRDRYGPPA